MIKEVHTLNASIMTFLDSYVTLKAQAQKVKSERFSEEEHLKIISIRYTAASNIWGQAKLYIDIMKKQYYATEKMKKLIKTSKDPKSIQIKITAKVTAYKKKSIVLWKKVQTLIDKASIDAKARQSENWNLRKRTVKLERKKQQCEVSMKTWSRQVSHLKVRRYELLVKASGVSQPPNVPKKRELQKVQPGKVQIQTKTHQGKKVTKTVTKNKQGQLVHTTSTKTIKRKQYWNYNFKQILDALADYNYKILDCTATLKTLPTVIAKRQSYFRNHVDRQSKCQSRKFKANMILQGKMGSFDGVSDKLAGVIKQLDEQIKKNANNAKTLNGLKGLKKRANYFKNDLQFKRWDQSFNMYQIRLMPCAE